MTHEHNPSNWHLKLWQYYPINYDPNHYHSLVAWWLDKVPTIGDKIIEVGTWSGLAPLWLKMNFPEKDVVGIDINPSVVHYAKTRAYFFQVDVPFYCGSGFDLKYYMDKSKDVLFSDGLVEHFEEEERTSMIKEFLRVAKYVVCTLPTTDCYVENTGYGDEIWENFSYWEKYFNNNFLIKKKENGEKEIFMKDGVFGCILEGIR